MADMDKQESIAIREKARKAVEQYDLGDLAGIVKAKSMKQTLIVR